MNYRNKAVLLRAMDKRIMAVSIVEIYDENGCNCRVNAQGSGFQVAKVLTCFGPSLDSCMEDVQNQIRSLPLDGSVRRRPFKPVAGR